MKGIFSFVDAVAVHAPTFIIIRVVVIVVQCVVVCDGAAEEMRSVSELKLPILCFSYTYSWPAPNSYSYGMTWSWLHTLTQYVFPFP